MLVCGALVSVSVSSGFSHCQSGQSSLQQAAEDKPGDNWKGNHVSVTEEGSAAEKASPLEQADLELYRLQSELSRLLETVQEQEEKKEKDDQQLHRLHLQMGSLLCGLQKQTLTLQETARLEQLQTQLDSLLPKAAAAKRALEARKQQVRQTEEEISAEQEKRERLWKEALEHQHSHARPDFRNGGSPRQNAVISGSGQTQATVRGKQQPEAGQGGYYDEQKTACFAFDGSLDPDQAELTSSSGFILPAAGSISAGTWQYPHGGLHLGMDLALPLMTPVLAPADGLVLYADAPVSSTGGYLGNWSGWPQGGGNTIALAVSVESGLYAVTFAHLSDTLYVQPGQRVKQSDIIALSGNSGNSTGPHTHIEVFEIHVSLQELISFFSQSADFSFGCGFDRAQQSSHIATRLRPEEVFLR